MNRDTQYQILIVDDEKDFSDRLARYMIHKRPKWKVFPVYDGLQALELLHQNIGFDAVLIDLMMQPMSGELLLEKVIEQYQDICPIIVTAYGSIPKAVLFAKIGVYDVQKKPVDFDELIGAIEEGIRYRMMSLITQNVLKMLSTEEVLDAVIQMAKLHFQTGEYYPAIIEKGAQHLILRRADTKDERIIDKSMTGPVPKFVEAVLKTGRTLRVMDIGPKDDWGNIVVDAKSLMAMPLGSQEIAIGKILSVESTQAKAFSIKDLVHLRMLAGFAAVALDNAKKHELEEQLRIREEQLRKREVQLRERERELAAGIAHEVKNVLQPAFTAHGRLNTWPLEGKTEYEKRLGTIHKCLKRINDLAIGLIDLERAGQLEIEAVNIRSVVDSAIEMLEDSTFEQSLTIESEYSAGLPLIPGDRKKLERVFYNIANNAAEAISAKGEPGQITVRTTIDKAKRSVVISFADTGIGIPPENFSKIFKGYFTTKNGYRGFGLGLTYAKQVVERHGGSIEVEPCPDKGAMFTIYLPMR